MVFFTNLLSSILLFTISFIPVKADDFSYETNVRSVRKAEYHGQWDISGKHTAMLCEALHKGQPAKDSELPEPDKDTYIKDGKCWKNQWIPCEDFDGDDRLATEGILAKRRKPCGHYKMVEDSDC